MVGGVVTYLDTRPSDLSNLLDLGTGLADQGAALRGGHDEPQRDGGTGYTAAAGSRILQTSRLKERQTDTQSHTGSQYGLHR